MSAMFVHWPRRQVDEKMMICRVIITVSASVEKHSEMLVIYLVHMTLST